MTTDNTTNPDIGAFIQAAIAGMAPQPKAPVPVPTRTLNPLTRLFDTATQQAGRLGISLPGAVSGYGTSYLPATDPKAAAAINAARTRYVAASAGLGTVSMQDINLLLAANEISPADARTLIKTVTDGGPGGGGGITAYEAAQLARQEQQDKIAAAMNVLQTVQSMSQQRDQRQSAMQSLIENASAYAIDPSQQYFSGMGPTDPAVNLGLTPALRTNPVTVSPRALLDNPYDAQIQAALAQLKGLSGIAA